MVYYIKTGLPVRVFPERLFSNNPNHWHKHSLGHKYIDQLFFGVFPGVSRKAGIHYFLQVGLDYPLLFHRLNCNP